MRKMRVVLECLCGTEITVDATVADAIADELVLSKTEIKAVKVYVEASPSVPPMVKVL